MIHSPLESNNSKPLKHPFHKTIILTLSYGRICVIYYMKMNNEMIDGAHLTPSRLILKRFESEVEWDMLEDEVEKYNWW